MARKQAKKRKQRKARKFKLPKIAFGRLSAVPAAFLVVFLCYETSAALLDRPIRAIAIQGPFERVSALEIEAAIGDEVDRGFVSADLEEIQKRIAGLTWIDKANVVRRWPDTLEIEVTEQVPAACWGERGLMNTRGELFVRNARHVPAELPRLSGPEGHSAEVARRYLEIRRHLIPLGLDLRRVHLDARGAWNLTLANGVEVRLGRRDTDTRTDLFLDVAANIVSRREGDIEFVDMRYSNGFTIGWDDGASPPGPATPDASRPAMVAGDLPPGARHAPDLPVPLQALADRSE
ncbi:MAG TPA: cell division protein FtsQ/DivIB [Woeseiaceae bacterium]|nr:cell division protein FtsQ/DivIB [Woeseiaceae bacterium]